MGAEVNLPGRLGDPNRTIGEDRRLDPRIGAALQAMEGFAPGVENIPVDSSYKDCLTYCAAFEDAAKLGHTMALEAMPAFDDVESSTETIKGVDDNDITLYIHRPKDASGPLPCVLHTHGGGMVLMTAQDPMFIRWRNSLAQRGMVVVGVEFRNGAGELGPHPFPAGLNDCASAAQWVHANRENLGISTVTISGESGGGNLCIATTLKAKQEGWLDAIDGVYAQCPYISGAYEDPPADLVSLTENDTYMLECVQMAVMVKVYTPNDNERNNPLAWPLNATSGELEGLPPVTITVNELDPLRDEGLAFLQKLLAAGNSAVGRTINGTPHAGDQAFPDITPDIFADSVRNLHGFAASL